MAERAFRNGGDRSGFVEWVGVLVCALTIPWVLLFFATLPLRSHASDKRDYAIYWATGQQLLHGGDPYDPHATARVEGAAGYLTQDSTMRNPPWSLALVAPLGLVTASAGALPWSLSILGVFVVCVRLLWTMYGGTSARLQWMGYCFPFALQCAMVGQTSVFVLLGVVLFLRLHTTRAFWAGAALWFCTLKPHLLLPFGVALLLWVLIHRKWTVLAGLASALAASSLLTAFLDPAAWTQYLHWAHGSGIAAEYIPSLSYFLQHGIDPAATWIAFVPCLLGCFWALFYVWPRRHRWNWLQDSGLLLVLSFLVAPYSWMYDQTILLPALLRTGCGTASRSLLSVLGMVYLLIDVQPFFSSRLQWTLNVWPPVVWLLWFLWARSGTRDRAATAACVPAAG